MAFTINNCIQALFVTGCILRMSCSDGSWQHYDHADVITKLPEIDSDMFFLTKNYFIAGTNSPTGTNATLVMWSVIVSVDGETINNDKKAAEGNNAILRTLPADQENYKIFSGTEGEMDSFVATKSPWSLIHVIAIDNNWKDEDHILSCF